MKLYIIVLFMLLSLATAIMGREEDIDKEIEERSADAAQIQVSGQQQVLDASLGKKRKMKGRKEGKERKKGRKKRKKGRKKGKKKKERKERKKKGKKKRRFKRTRRCGGNRQHCCLKGRIGRDSARGKKGKCWLKYYCAKKEPGVYRCYPEPE